MKKYNSILLILITIFFVSSCKKDLIDTIKKIDPGKTSTYPLNGEYWVQLDAAPIATPTAWSNALGYKKIIISNTSTDKGDSIWIDDLKNIWSFKVKTACNPTLMTFNVTDGKELYYDDATTIKNGKLILDIGISRGGNKTDSIYMEISWASDAANVYRLSGVRRTGFTEDDY